MKRIAARTSASRQQGVVLFVALIVLVIMALTGIAMIRQSGTGLSIAGNVGMRQNALSAADLGTEAALSWWVPLRGTPALDNTSQTDGYFSDWGNTDVKRKKGDPTTYDWTNANSKLVTSDDGTGNEVRYVIERLCVLPNTTMSDPNQQCVETEISEGGDKSGTCDNYPKSCPELPKIVQFRVSSRVVGPRNTVSYIQVMLSSAG